MAIYIPCSSNNILNFLRNCDKMQSTQYHIIEKMIESTPAEVVQRLQTVENLDIVAIYASKISVSHKMSQMSTMLGVDDALGSWRIAYTDERIARNEIECCSYPSPVLFPSQLSAITMINCNRL